MVSSGLGVAVVQIADPRLLHMYPVRMLRLGRGAAAAVEDDTQWLPGRCRGLGQVALVESGTGRMLGTVDGSSAPATAHSGAVYLHRGESYLVGGDVIVAVDGAPVGAFEQLREAVARKKPGDKIKLDIVRNGSKRSVTVKLGQAPSG